MGMKPWEQEIPPLTTQAEYEALKANTAKKRRAAQKVLDAYRAESKLVEAKWRTRRTKANDTIDSLRYDEQRLYEYEFQQEVAACPFAVGDIVVDEFGNKYRVADFCRARDYDTDAVVLAYHVRKLNKDGSANIRSWQRGHMHWTKWEPTS